MPTAIDIKKEIVSILLVDDEPLFRQGIRTLLDFYNISGAYNFKVIAEAASVEQAIGLTIEQHPALVLLDLELPPDNGITVLQRLSKLSYGGKVLILSGHHQDEWVFNAMKAGAWGYVFKDKLAMQLCEAITTVMNEQVYLPPDVATGFFRLFQSYSSEFIKGKNKVNLTPQEQEILKWLVQGETNEEIATHLYVTVATVKAHLTAIFKKLGVVSRTQAIVKALKLGLVCP